MKLNSLALLFVIILLVTGCGGGGGGGVFLPTATLVSIAVTPVNPSIPKGASQQFTATGTYSDNSTHDVTAQVAWNSSNTGTATISSTGLAAAVAIGTTTITAASGTITSTPVTLTVTATALVSIAVTPANPSTPVGTPVQFTATGTNTDGTKPDLTSSVTWSSQATSVATISSTGLATPVGPGTTTIKAVAGSISGATVLTVTGGNAAANVVPISVNGSLCSSAFNATYPNKPCVSVTVCTPGTATCQTINDILLDTGSYGLRIFNQVLTVPLTQVTVPLGNLANCVQYVDGSADWGPVQSADVVLGGEPAVTVPIQVINAAFATVPTACGTPDASPAAAGFNGILGVGLFAEDCGSWCTTACGLPDCTQNGVYYACSGSNCSGTTVPLNIQVQNPVAHLPVDNNGVLVQLPVVPLGGAASLNGQLLLGIGTQTNNTPSGVTVFPANPTSAEFTTVFNGTTFINSFIDTGSNGLFFGSSVFTVCGGWYCPSSTQTLSATTKGFTGTPSVNVPFKIGNATSLFNSGNHVFMELGGSLPGSFDWGLPFFYGRNVFVGIEPSPGLKLSPSPLGIGPYWAY